MIRAARAFGLAALFGSTMIASAGAFTARRPLPLLPLPPVPPVDGPVLHAAPRADMLAAEPAPLSFPDDGPTVAPAWFGDQPANTGDNVYPGSTVTVRPTSRMDLAPGVEFRLPLK